MQQSFSSETEPVLWKTYPLLEFISQVWDEMLKDPTYVPMQAGIEAGLGMIHKYTSLAKASDANIMCLGMYYKCLTTWWSTNPYISAWSWYQGWLFQNSMDFQKIWSSNEDSLDGGE